MALSMSAMMRRGVPGNRSKKSSQASRFLRANGRISQTRSW
jgi:hypothetical protein